MSLDLTPVHRNLHTKVTFLGLEFEDLIGKASMALAGRLSSLPGSSGACGGWIRP